MTELFKAGNGLEVGVGSDGMVLAQCRTRSFDGAECTQALREFFQHERDQELGRWRWPENPDYVVYLDRTRRFVHQPAVLVVNERDGGQAYVSRDGELSAFGVGARDGSLEHAANAFFAAHPESKPWADAKDGEVWLLMFPNSTQAWFVNGGYFQNVRTLTNINKTDPGITAGRRIWPEVSDA